MRIYLTSVISVFLFSFTARAIDFTCHFQNGRLIMATNASGGVTVQSGRSAPAPVIRTVQLRLTESQVDRCPISQGDTGFKRCLVSEFGLLDAYQEGLPVLLAFLLHQKRMGTSDIGFDTSKIASGKMHYTSELNPAFGSSSFVQFYDDQRRLVGSIFSPGLGALLDCK